MLLLAVTSLVTAQVVNIPDPKLKGCLLALKHANGDKVDYDNDGEIQVSEAQAFTGKINCYGTDITNATGIEAFENITELMLTQTKIAVLDLSNNTSLESLTIWQSDLSTLDLSSNTVLKTVTITKNSKLTALDLSSNTALEVLTCNQNQLETLDLSNKTALKKLSCNENRLTSLLINNCTNLEELSCGQNQLTTLDLSNNTKLKTLHCYNNKLTSLLINNCTNLEKLFCDKNQLTTLDLSGNTSLNTLTCNENKLTTLDISSNTNLEELHCYGNQLTVLDVSSNTKLKNLRCDNNKLTDLDISSNTALSSLSFGGNDIVTLEVSNSPSLISIRCFNDKKLTTLYANNCPNLQRIDCWFSSKLHTLEVGNSTSLTYLRCNYGQLDALDISTNTKLKEVEVISNKLTSLNVGHLPNLENVRCDNNKLTSLNVGNSTKLHTLTCGDNQLTSLNVANNTELKVFNCHNNQLTSLDVTSCAKLQGLICFNNQLTTLDVSNKPNLNEVQCHNNQLESLDVSGSPKLKNLYCHYNKLETLDVRSSTALQNLFCQNNQLTALELGINTSYPLVINCSDNELTNLDLTGSTGLFFLNCYRNQLETLDVSNNPNLKTLNCFNNQLAGLDLSGNPNLEVFECQNNQLTSLNLKNGNNANILAKNVDIRKNNDLRCILVDDVAYSNADWSVKTDPTACFSESGCKTPTFAHIPPICKGDPLTLPTASEDETPISGTWSPAFDNQQTTVYTFTPDACNNSVKMEVVVNPKPDVTLVSDISVEGNNTICEGQTVTLTANGATTYVWNNGLGSGATKEVSPTATTVYQVTGTNDEGCTDTKTIEITVNPKPEVTLVSDIPSADNNAVCFGRTVKLTTSGANVYAWTGNGTSGLAAEQIVTPTANETYTVTGTDANGCVSDKKEITITVKPNPVVTLTPDPTICEGEAITLKADGADTYSWDNGLGTGAVKKVSPTATTTYKATGTTNGCASDVKEVTVSVNPKPTITLTPDQTICAGQTVTLTASGALTYSWIDNGTILSGNGNEQTLTPTVGTHVYKVIGTTVEGCTSEEEELTVVVNAKPVAALDADKTTICAGETVILKASGAPTLGPKDWATGKQKKFHRQPRLFTVHRTKKSLPLPSIRRQRPGSTPSDRSTTAKVLRCQRHPPTAFREPGPRQSTTRKPRNTHSPQMRASARRKLK